MQKNPYKRVSDSIPVWVKIFWKSKVSPLIGNPYYHEIFPGFYLGAQPNRSTIENLSIGQGGEKRTVNIVNFLTRGEIKPIDNTEEINSSFLPVRDHNLIYAKTGKNLTVDEILDFLNKLYEQKQNNPSSIFYFHCMAGRSRSFVGTMAFAYFHPNQQELFSGRWLGENKISKDLKERLQNNHSFSDIAEFIKLLRPKVKAISKMDGDQAGILGLMSLRKFADDGEKIIAGRGYERLLKDAQNIGLMLKSPLDYAFRNENDRKQQEDNLNKVFQIFQNQQVNLLKVMIVPISKAVEPNDYSTSESLKENFSKLKPSEQARFAVLLKGLEGRYHSSFLNMDNRSIDYAKEAIKNVDQLTVGDQVELLRSFGAKELQLNYKDVADRILKGSSIDRYNSGLQLAELLTVAINNKNNDFEAYATTIFAKNLLSRDEQLNFLARLSEKGNILVEPFNSYAEKVKKNCQGVWFRFFNRSMSDKLLERIGDLTGQFEKKPELEKITIY